MNVKYIYQDKPLGELGYFPNLDEQKIVRSDLMVKSSTYKYYPDTVFIKKDSETTLSGWGGRH